MDEARIRYLTDAKARRLAQAGVDLLTISKLLGHADTRITAKHCAHLADKTLALAVTKLPARKTPKAEIEMARKRYKAMLNGRKL